jgi:gamma-glutamyltranspeptidase/glutathione hydrolase
MRKNVFIFFFCFGSLFSQQPNNAGISSAHPLASSIGVDILAMGGNAFDAAVAVSAVLSVVEPFGSGFGGGGLFLVYDSGHNKFTMIDAREVAPIQSRADMFLDGQGNPIPRLSLDGALAAGIPGLPKGLAYLATHYGNLPLATSLMPAVTIARDGFEVDERLADRVASQWHRFNEEARTVFSIEGHPAKEGDWLVQENLANTLTSIARTGGESFYFGEIRDQLLSTSNEYGGIWESQDFTDYLVVEREPIRTTIGGYDLISSPPPSSGGIAIANMLNMIGALNYFELNKNERNHVLIEVMRRAYRDRSIYLGDSDFINIPMENLISSDYAYGQLSNFNPTRATLSQSYADTAIDKSQGDQTTHFSIIDEDGNIVSATLSINFNFGSGLMAPGTGVFLNNEMDDFSIKPGVPNGYGLIGSYANAIEPKKRMLSSMSPTVMIGEQGLLVTGTPGGSRIISMVLLSILNWMEGMPIEDVVAYPRFHHQFLPDKVEYESGAFTDEQIQFLESLGHTLEVMPSSYGNLNALTWLFKSNNVIGAADPRGLGSVAYRD